MLLHGQGFGGGDEKDWVGWSSVIILRGIGGSCWRLTLESRSQSQTMRLGAGLPSNTWYTNLLWGRGQSCLCRKSSTSAEKNITVLVPWNPPPSFPDIPPLPRAPCPHLELPLVLPAFPFFSFVPPLLIEEVLLFPLMAFLLL